MEEVRDTAKSWGTRINVPIDVVRWLKIETGNGVLWKLSEQEGERVAILKKEVKEK